LNVSEPPLAVTRGDTLQAAVPLSGVAARSVSLAEQKADTTLGRPKVGRTYAIIEAYELGK
jgi:hypothetical protein